jgi:hypothetical protein
MICFTGLAISWCRVYCPVVRRRERPDPGAQLSLLDTHAGCRHTRFSTNTESADNTALARRHRAWSQGDMFRGRIGQGRAHDDALSGSSILSPSSLIKP